MAPRCPTGSYGSAVAAVSAAAAAVVVAAVSAAAAAAVVAAVAVAAVVVAAGAAAAGARTCLLLRGDGAARADRRAGHRHPARERAGRPDGPRVHQLPRGGRHRQVVAPR